jgi:hypothetical protein
VVVDELLVFGVALHVLRDGVDVLPLDHESQDGVGEALLDGAESQWR